MYQVQCATEQFGEAGKGWGWSFSEPLFLANETVVIKCTLWHGSKENTIEHYGQKKLADSKGKIDEDALKKAGTDGLTKCLSYLGFNADVFLGKFDDNKYVEELRAQEEKRNNAEQFVNGFLKDIDKALFDDIPSLEKANKDRLDKIKAGYPDLYKAIETAKAMKSSTI